MLTKCYKKILIIDGSYLIHRSLKISTLWELKTSKGERTGGIFGFLRSMNSEIRSIPSDYYPVVTWDAGLDARRTEVYPEYKRAHIKLAEHLARNGESEESIIEKLSSAGNPQSSVDQAIESIRESIKSQRSGVLAEYNQDDYVIQYHRQRDRLITVLTALGIPSIKVNGWEGDDLMVLLSRLADKSVVMTDDKDLIQLISPNTMIFRPIAKEVLKCDEYMESHNMYSTREIIYNKAIVGDPSDNIPSVTYNLERKNRVGGVRAQTISRMIAEAKEDPSIYLPRLTEMHKNYYDGFVMNHSVFLRNMKLVDLDLVPDDESVVSTIKSEISSKAGKASLVSSIKLLAELEINSFDINGCISRVLSSYPNIKEIN